MTDYRNTINLDFNYFFPGIPVPFLKDVIRNFVLNTNSNIFVRSEDRDFNYEPIFDCLQFAEA